MKTKFISLLVLLLLSAQLLSAQGFSVQAFLGSGGAGLLTGGKDDDKGTGGNSSMKVATSLTFAYHFNRFSISSGLIYFGTNFDEFSNSSPFPEPFSISQSFSFRNFMVPLNFNMHMPMGKWFEFIPSAGVGVSYTTRAVQEIYSPMPDRRILPEAEFESLFRRVNLWGIAGLKLGCNFNERMAIIAGIDVEATISRIQKEKQINRSDLRLLAGYAGLSFRYKFYTKK